MAKFKVKFDIPGQALNRNLNIPLQILGLMPIRTPFDNELQIVASRFAMLFDQATRGPQKRELPLFRSLQATLLRVGGMNGITVEEYHGAGHQVTFVGQRPYSRTEARCELADLMVIVFNNVERSVRLTYIQAKSERQVQANRFGVDGCGLTANLEQWDLLARRPLIDGVNRFQCPRDLLKSALLDSIGSFVFFLHTGTHKQIYYACARQLAPKKSGTRIVKQLLARENIIEVGRYVECRSVYDNYSFGYCLFGGMIGTPIVERGKIVGSIELAKWLARELRGLVVAATSPSYLGELALLLDPDGIESSTSPSVGAKSVVVITTSFENNLKGLEHESVLR